MKQRIFIGSSSEALEIANYIESQLEPEFDCNIWNDDIFKYNDSFFETLIREAKIFDYGILIATKDDFTVSREDEFDSPRDNVIFEFGLFIGAMGAEKAFLIQEKGAKLPSDLLGITIESFELQPDLSKSEGLSNFIRKIKMTIAEKAELGMLSHLPSTSLAIGYFENFLKPLSEQLFTCDEIVLDGKRIDEFEISILIPNELNSDIKKYAQVYYKKHNLNQTAIDTPGRSFPVYIAYDKQSDSKVKIYDIPATLGGIDKAIEMLLQKGHIGKTSQQTLLEERELRNFESTLRHLVENDSYSKELVKILKL